MLLLCGGTFCAAHLMTDRLGVKTLPRFVDGDTALAKTSPAADPVVVEGNRRWRERCVVGAFAVSASVHGRKRHLRARHDLRLRR